MHDLTEHGAVQLGDRLDRLLYDVEATFHLRLEERHYAFT